MLMPILLSSPIHCAQNGYTIHIKWMCATGRIAIDNTKFPSKVVTTRGMASGVVSIHDTNTNTQHSIRAIDFSISIAYCLHGQRTNTKQN